MRTKSFSSHSNSPLDILDYVIEFTLIFKLQSRAEQPVFLPFYVERTNSSTGILGITAIQKIDL